MGDDRAPRDIRVVSTGRITVDACSTFLLVLAIATSGGAGARYCATNKPSVAANDKFPVVGRGGGGEIITIRLLKKRIEETIEESAEISREFASQNGFSRRERARGGSGATCGGCCASRSKVFSVNRSVCVGTRETNENLAG